MAAIEIDKSSDNTGGVFVKKSAFTLFTRVILIVVSFGASVVTARLLGPAGKGQLSVILLAPTLLMNLGGLAITSSNVFLIGRRKPKLNEIFWNSTLFSIVLGILLILIFLIFRPWLDSFFRNADPVLITIALATVPFSLFYVYGIFIPLGERKVVAYNILKVIEPVVYFMALVIFIWILKLEIIGGLVAYIFGILGGCIALLVYAKRHIPLKFQLNLKLIKEGCVYGAKCHVESAAWFFIRRISVLLINKYMEPKDVGWYVVAVALSEALWHLPMSISTVLFPEICSKHNACNQKEMASRVCRNSIFILVVSAIILGAFAYLLINFFYGREYSPSINALLLLLPGSVLLGAMLVLSTYMRGINRPMVASLIACAMLVCTVITNIILIPLMGIYGAALSLSVTAAIGFVLIVVIYAKMTGEKAAQFLIIGREDFQYYRDMYSRLIVSRFKKDGKSI